MSHDANFASEPTPSPRWRVRYVEEVRRRLEEGELDSEDALRETAHALLDGDAPVG